MRRVPHLADRRILIDRVLLISESNCEVYERRSGRLQCIIVADDLAVIYTMRINSIFAKAERLVVSDL